MDESVTTIPKALVEFFIVFGSFYVPCVIGSVISFFIKREKTIKTSISDNKQVPEIDKKKTVIGILLSAILPAIVITALYETLQEKIHNGAVLMAVAALFGAIGDDLRKLVTFKGVIAVIKVITNGIASISQLEDAIVASDDTSDVNKTEVPPKEPETTSEPPKADNETNNAGASTDSVDAGPPSEDTPSDNNPTNTSDS